MATSNSWHGTATQLAPVNRSDAAGRIHLAGKRVMDFGLSVTGLGLGLPVMALAAALVHLESRGPAFTRTRCWGRGARTFMRLRLRTCDDAGRTTRVGRVLCRWGIDGLPQLVNVLLGEMSIVGPRPVPSGAVVAASVRHMRRLELQPGITGLWAMGISREFEINRYFSSDEYYQSNWSPWLDLSILVHTLGGLAAGFAF